ncbi:MAG: insulinase family protein [Vulcanimicrobiaceae bacterium]
MNKLLAVLPLVGLLLGAMPALQVLPDAASPIAVAAFSVPAGLDRQTDSENGLAAFTAYAILEENVSDGTSLLDAVMAQGGTISVNVTSRASLFTITALPDRFASVVALFARALQHPDFSPVTMAHTREALLAQFADAQDNGVLVAEQMIDGVQATANESAATPLGLPATIVAIRASTVQKFFTVNYRRDGATIVATDGTTKAPIASLIDALEPGAPAKIKAEMRPLVGASRELQATREHASLAYVLSFSAPGPRDAAAPAAFVFAQMLQTSIAQLSGLPDIPSRSLTDGAIDVTYDYLHVPSRYLVTIDGSLGNASQVVSVTMGLAKAFSSLHFKGNVERFVAIARGRLLAGARTPTARVEMSAQFVADGLPIDQLAIFDRELGSVNAAMLEHAARGLRSAPTIAIVGSVDGN